MTDSYIAYVKYAVQKKTLEAAGWVLADVKSVRSSVQQMFNSIDNLLVERIKHELVYGFAHLQTGRVWTTTVMYAVEDYKVDRDSGERTMEYRRVNEDKPEEHVWKELFAALSSK